MTASRDELAERHRLLADFGAFALRCDDLSAVLAEGCRIVARALRTDVVRVVELDADGGAARVRAGIGWAADMVGTHLDADETAFAVRSIGPESPAMTQDTAPPTRSLRARGVSAIVGAPIILPGGKPYGVFQALARAPGAFDQEDIAFLRTYCAVLGLIVDRLFKMAALERTDERFRLVVENAHGFAIILSDQDDIITDWFPGATEVFGWSEEEMIGRTMADIFTPEDRLSGIPERESAEARANGKAPDFRWHVTKGGGRVFVDGQTIALRNPDGTVAGFLKIGQDLTDRKRNEERQTVLLAELQHRVRNVLAMVASVVKRGDAAVSTQEFRDRLSGRIAAMARTQALLTRGPGVGVAVEGIIRDELIAQDAEESRVKVAGPQISLSPKAAEVLTLAIHELATNAAKYGALLQPRGRITVGWRLDRRDERDWLALEWRESAVENPADAGHGRGFGTELITRRVPYELGGEGELTVAADGLRCRIAFPLAAGDSILQTNSPPLPNIRETGS
ncbi:PAS domain S-box protein [Sphingomonas sp. H39-1-10]|uniref:sensor histidine kinase n=1 Tax=Sphingomonas pollutisoli TaxID=3030829 RepID=UPI0023B8A175|nr:PAS domain S-box protein [Sphingomonas pollutisoli]MDF0490194.1 PAS domain S-box protein [Sphingomonas pollutisoli]